MKQVIKTFLEGTPVVRSLYYTVRKPLYERKFATTSYGSFRGIFNTFEEAIQSAPKTKAIGYDNPELAAEYVQMLETGNWENGKCLIRPLDYPVMFWLNMLLNLQHVPPTIFDFGGNVGFHYYTYAKYIPYPELLKWTVCEVPAIEAAGRKLAEKLSASNLSFLSDFAEVTHYEIFLASGSLQYMPNFLVSLAQLPRKPSHLLINRLPLYDGEEYVTLQNGGKVFYPQYVFNRSNFVESLAKLGYKLVDCWEDAQDTCIIPFHPERSMQCYQGLYLKLETE